MMVLALFPPVWRAVMDERVLAHYGGDVTRANMYPPKARKLIKRYAPTLAEVAA